MAGKVSDQSTAVAKMAKDWPLIDALVGGTDSMRAHGKVYLPKWPKEEEEDYQERLNIAVLFNAFGRTTDTLSAKPFSRPITFDGLADGIDKYLTNIDAQATDIHSFGAQVIACCLQYGLHGVLVEAPTTEGIVTRQQELDAGVRPYLTQYACSSILGWRAKRDANGGSYLTQLRLMEEVTEPDGQFGESIVKQVRVLQPGEWQIWREKRTENGMEWYLYQNGFTSLKKIPFVFFYGLKAGFGLGKPPLIDLAHLNVKHWQSSSDQQSILHVARVPILFAKGFTTSDNLVVGAKHAASSISPEADLKYVEHTGAAIDSGRQDILDIEDQMRQIGAELTVQRPSATTATAVSSDDESNRSIMQKICEEFEDSLELCLQLMGEWEGKNSTPTVKVFKDFKSEQLGEKSADFLQRSVESGAISRETSFEHAQRADLLSPDLKWEDERKRLEGESALRKQLAAEAAPPKPPATKPKAAD